ncbi:hypothetical protein H1Q59_08060 [Holosporaceae bacterium 'Namur']|nr:hypothetical protein [Holosporaceae bacterium 'Namur']
MNTREKLCKKIDNSRYLGKISKKLLKWFVMNLNNNVYVTDFNMNQTKISREIAGFKAINSTYSSSNYIQDLITHPIYQSFSCNIYNPTYTQQHDTNHYNKQW